jgi:signal transduction histidine kinase
VNNAVKYSDTRSLEVNIEIQHKNIVMHIKDYGKGFDEKIILKGNGLDNMHVRAKELKGNLRISSQPEQGTELSLTFPVTG